jgi:hypothetical protein
MASRRARRIALPSGASECRWALTCGRGWCRAKKTLLGGNGQTRLSVDCIKWSGVYASSAERMNNLI